MALTCWVALYDWQIIHLQSGITATPGKANYVVLSIIYKLWSFFNVYVIGAHIEHHFDIAFLL